LPRLASGRTRPSRFAAAVAALGLSGIALAGVPAAAAPPTAKRCLAASEVITLKGTYRDEVRYPALIDGVTFDARSARFLAYPNQSQYPFSIGKANAPAATCVVGGLVVGQQSHSLTWDQMKNAYDGDGLRISARRGAVVDGLRVENVEDGVAPRGTEVRYPKDGDGFVLRNLYFRYIRDDCVENDDIGGGVISDSLFDGCYTGVSERPSDGNRQLSYRAPRGEKLILDGVLLRLQALPGPRGSDDPAKLGHGQLFKWSAVSNALVVRHSVFLVERRPNTDSYFPFPRGTVTEDVTIVWGGPGAFVWRVPEGTTVTRDRTVWDRARALWLARHGCVSFVACSRLSDPLTLARPGSSMPAHTPQAGPRLAALPKTVEPLKTLPRVPLVLAIMALAGTVGLFVVVKASPRAVWGAAEVPWSSATEEAG
jgi:hypothetical protein